MKTFGWNRCNNLKYVSYHIRVPEEYSRDGFDKLFFKNIYVLLFIRRRCQACDSKPQKGCAAILNSQMHFCVETSIIVYRSSEVDDIGKFLLHLSAIRIILSDDRICFYRIVDLFEVMPANAMSYVSGVCVQTSIILYRASEVDD